MSETAQKRGPRDKGPWTLDPSTAWIALLLLVLLAIAVPKKPVEKDVSAGGWLASVQQNLAGRGYDWLKIDVADGVATVSGEAPDVDSRQFGFEAAEAAIQRSDADDTVRVVVDATTMEGAPASIGAALNTLGAAPTASACGDAFAATLQGRTINFEQGSATLSADNQRLLDALSAVAIRCKAHAVEIGGHTDRSGDADANLTLSQQRAEAVQRYLTDKGVPAAKLTAHGYGSRLLLDPGRTPEADARNRRIEFTVSAN